MFFENYVTRLKTWHSFRQNLETTPTPLEDVIDFWNKAPLSAKTCDPFSEETWPDAWELIESNNYCEFSKILAIYYTLSFTNRFSESYFEIQVVNNIDEKVIHYFLIVDDIVFGYHFDKVLKRSEIPDNLLVLTSYKR